jgi:serine/threonine-protein kinase
MIELHTFGRIELKSSAGQEIRAVTAQPKRAALLAYLAAAQPRGFHRRDALLALFWPELDQDRARAALRKAVHHLRRAVGEEAVVGRGDEELALAGHLVWSDVSAFESSLEAGDAQAAVALYQGPFLDAFFVPDAPEFERWMETERARLHRRAFDAAWQVAETEERKGNTFGAAYWARRAAALAPADEAAMRRLMALLDRMGDRAGAVQAYEEFARRIKAELDIEPSAETQAAVRSIRTAAEPAAEVASDPPPAPAPEAGPAVPAVGRPGTGSPRPRLTWLRMAVPAAAVLAVGAVALATRERTQAAANLSPDVVAVFPFSMRGDPSLEYLEEGLSTLLSTGLDGAGEIRSVDPHALLAAVGETEGIRSDPAAASRVAASFGAGVYVLGDVVGTGSQLRLDARLYRVRDRGRAAGSATAQGTTDSLFGLVDRVAAQLIAAQRGDSARAVPRLAALTTHSIPALKAYLEGEREFRRGAFPRAIAGYQRAVALDSTFAMAYYRLAETYSWSGSDSSRQVAELAVRFGQRLPVAERDLLQAFLLYEEGRTEEAERLYREILRRRPQELDAVFQLGELMFHHNGTRGRSVGESRPFFQQARQWNHSDAPLIHLLELSALERNYQSYDSLMALVAPESHFWLTGIMVHALLPGGEAKWARAEAELRRASDRELATAGSHALYLLEDAAAADRALRLLIEPTRSPTLRAVGHLLYAHLYMAGGRWRAALTALDSARGLDPAAAGPHAGLLFALPHLPVPGAQLEQVHAAVAAAGTVASPNLGTLLYADPDTLHPSSREYALALLDARLGRTDQALRRAAVLERADHGDRPGLAGAFAAGIRAQLALLGNDAARAGAELGTIRWRPRPMDVLAFSPVRGLRHERFLRAEALDRQGKHEEALGWFSSFDEHSPGGRIYLAPAHFRRGQILERLGRAAEAAASYRRFVGLWQDADPELQTLVSEARQRLARLEPERDGT